MIENCFDAIKPKTKDQVGPKIFLNYPNILCISHFCLKIWNDAELVNITSLKKKQKIYHYVKHAINCKYFFPNKSVSSNRISIISNLVTNASWLIMLHNMKTAFKSFLKLCVFLSILTSFNALILSILMNFLKKHKVLWPVFVDEVQLPQG